nr:hypothetical protein [Tanacetum cinerariifolium]
MSEDLTYSMLHEMVMQKFNLEANVVINLSFKLSSFDFAVDITDDSEVQFFVGCACNSNDEFAHLFVSEQKNNQKNMFFNFLESTTLENEGPSNPEIQSSHFNEPYFSNPESSFDFRLNKYNTEDVVNKNPQNKIHKWQKFVSFKPDIPDTPVYKAKPNISKQHSQQSEVQKGKIFDNKESLILAVRLKVVSEVKGKHYGIQQVRGSPYEAFEMLPYYCYNLEKKNEGTVTHIKTDDNGVFEMLFIAIGASIRTFHNYLRPVIMIDAAHLTGLYKGTNLVAVAISDRHAAIALAVEKEFTLAFHAVCCRHLMMNLGLKNQKRQGLFWKICKAYTREDYAMNMNTLQIVQPDAHEKLCRAGPQRWSRAHCPLVR